MDDMQQTSNEQWQNGSNSDSHSMNIYISCLTFKFKFINGIPIEFSKSLRNLGIIFDNFSLHQNIMNTYIHKCFRNLTIAILYCLVLHSTSSNYFRKLKIKLLEFHS